VSTWVHPWFLVGVRVPHFVQFIVLFYYVSLRFEFRVVMSLTISEWNNLHNEKIGKPNNLKVFRRKRTKGPKQNSQSRLRSHMTEGMREENLKFINNYIIPGLWITTHVTIFYTIFSYIVLVSFIVNGNRIKITDLSEVTDIIHGIELGSNLSDHISLLCNGFVLLVMVSLLFCPFSISRCIVCSSATYRVW
jgi:hypothetical protein